MMTPDQLRQQMMAQLQGAPQGQGQPPPVTPPQGQLMQQQFAPPQQPPQGQLMQQQFAPPQQPPQGQLMQQQFAPPQQQFAPPQGQPGAGPVVQPQQPLEALFQGQPSQPQAQQSAPTQGQFAPPQGQPEAPATKPGRPAGTKKRKTLTLCLDCVVLFRGAAEDVVPLAAFVEPSRALAAQQGQVTDQSLVACVRQQLQTPLASDTTVYVDRSTPLARTLLDVLTSVADVVYVGV